MRSSGVRPSSSSPEECNMKVTPETRSKNVAAPISFSIPPLSDPVRDCSERGKRTRVRTFPPSQRRGRALAPAENGPKWGGARGEAGGKGGANHTRDSAWNGRTRMARGCWSRSLRHDRQHSQATQECHAARSSGSTPVRASVFSSARMCYPCEIRKRHRQDCLSSLGEFKLS
jgi:hypothetical protein